MGRDKANIRIDGATLLQRVCAAAQQAGLPVVVVGRTTPDVLSDQTISWFPDEVPGQGPLRGLQTALRHAPHSNILLTACDLPQIAAADFTWLAQQAQLAFDPESENRGPENMPLGLISVVHERPQPLFAVYRPECLPLVERLLAGAQYAMHTLLAAGRFAYINLPDPHAAAARDVDTPQEMREVLRQS